VEDEDWARRTQAELPAIRIGRLVIAPPWDLPSRESLVAGREVVIEIEPSRGFGTGHHQSTRLCLVLLQARDLVARTTIDVGTGSGVLAIAAAKLGAAFVSAIDVDPDAVENARENIERNGVGRMVEAHIADLTATSASSADVVTANLTGTLLARHAADLAKLVKPDGALIVAGFTIDERAMVEAAFAPALIVTETAEEDGWWAFVLTRAS
jgi:ribosomal protein L11 methyltransferase